jgi:hypothetical protein
LKREPLAGVGVHPDAHALTAIHGPPFDAVVLVAFTLEMIEHQQGIVEVQFAPSQTVYFTDHQTRTAQHRRNPGGTSSNRKPLKYANRTRSTPTPFMACWLTMPRLSVPYTKISSVTLKCTVLQRG